MRKALLLSLVLVLPAVTASGQGRKQYRPSDQTSEGAIKFGLKLGGGSFITMGAEEGGFTRSMIPRFHAGVFGEYRLADETGLQLALLYSGQGVKTKPSQYRPGDPKYKTEYKLNYLLAAPTLRLYPGADRQFCLFVGPYLGYCMSAMAYQYIDDKQQGQGLNLKENKAIRNLDWGIVAGYDYEFAMGLLLGATYNIGLGNIIKNRLPDDKNKMRNLGVQLSAGYNFAKLIQ